MLILRKREEKLNQKELQKIKLLHPNPVVPLANMNSVQSNNQEHPLLHMNSIFGQ